jgi:hypothetical protein
MDRRIEYWSTLVLGVVAAGSWVSQTVKAVTADGDLSAKGLFVWLAAVTAGVAIGVVLGTLTAGFRARQDAREMARRGPNAVWDMTRLPLLGGIMFLGWSTGPIYAEPHDLGAWINPAASAAAAGCMFGLAVVLREERRLPIPPPPGYYPPPPGHTAAPGYPPPPTYPSPPSYPPPPGYRPNPSGWRPSA